MSESKALTFTAVIPNSGTPIGFAGGDGDGGFIKLQRYMTVQQSEQVLNLRGAVLKLTIRDE